MPRQPEPTSTVRRSSRLSREPQTEPVGARVPRAGAGVVAEVIDTIKADKVITFHKRRRKHSSQRTRGHRQQLTLLRVTELLESGADRSDVKAAVGARSGTGPRVKGDDRYAMNKSDQAEMAARVATGEAGEKSAETAEKPKRARKTAAAESTEA